MTMRTVGDWNEEGKREAAALEELRSALVETVSRADARAGGKVDGVYHKMSATVSVRY